MRKTLPKWFFDGIFFIKRFVFFKRGEIENIKQPICYSQPAQYTVIFADPFFHTTSPFVCINLLRKPMNIHLSKQTLDAQISFTAIIIKYKYPASLRNIF